MSTKNVVLTNQGNEFADAILIERNQHFTSVVHPLANGPSKVSRNQRVGANAAGGGAQ